MNTKRFWLAGLLLGGLVLQAAALDLNFDLGLNQCGYYRYASEPGVRQTTAASLGLSATDFLYLELDFWAANRLGDSATQWMVPVEQDYTLSADFSIDVVSLGLSATIYALPGQTRADVGVYYYSSIPLFGDLLALDNGLSVMTDFTGLYAEANLEPNITLPLATPLNIGISAKLGLVALGYDGLAYNGLSHLMLQPKILLKISKTLALNLFGGYTFDLSPAGTASYPFLGGKISFSFESDS